MLQGELIDPGHCLQERGVMKLRPDKLGSNDLGFKQLTSFFQNLLEGSPLGDCEYQALLLLTGSP